MADDSRHLRYRIFACWRELLDVGVTGLVLIAAIAMLWNIWYPRPSAGHISIADLNALVSIEGAPTRGSSNAEVAVVVYSDFQCAFCAKAFYELLPQIEREYVAAGRVAFVFRHYPLQSIHPSAVTAAVAAECAGRQSKLWALQERLYKHRGHLDPGLIRNDVITTGVDVAQWDACMSSPDAQAAVDRDRAAAGAIGVKGTPTFLIGRIRSRSRVQVFKQIVGVSTIAEWRSVLDEMLARRD